MKTLFVMLALIIVMGACSESGQKQARLLKTGEKFYVRTTLYSAGDTIVVYYSPAREQFLMDTNWPMFEGNEFRGQYGLWYKAVIL